MTANSHRKPDVESYFRSKAATLLAELKHIRSLIPDKHHSLTVGEYYESCITRFIKDTVLPSDCMIGRGFMLDIKLKLISKQCDILIYEPEILRPIYTEGAFVIVDPVSVRFVVEVKAKINSGSKELNKIIQHWKSIDSLMYHFTGYALVSLFDHSLSDTTKQTLSELSFFCSFKKGYACIDKGWNSDLDEVNNVMEFIKAVYINLKYTPAQPQVALFPEDKKAKDQ